MISQHPHIHHFSKLKLHMNIVGFAQLISLNSKKIIALFNALFSGAIIRRSVICFKDVERMNFSLMHRPKIAFKIIDQDGPVCCHDDKSLVILNRHHRAYALKILHCTYLFIVMAFA